MKNKKYLGQVFSPEDIVDKMLLLRENFGTILEPSCGDGAFFNKIENCVGIEIDPEFCPDSALNMDFFDYDTSNKFDTIIGNPPYVAFKRISDDTKSKLDMSFFDERTNLFLFFIKKCIEHLNPGGELIFITPREFMKATSSIKLNKYIYDNGTFTYFEDLGDAKIFDDACPNCVIFRYKLGDISHTLYDGRTMIYDNGQLLISDRKQDDCIHLSDIASVKVGGVSGLDSIFINEEYGNLDFVYSETAKNGKTRKMICDIKIPYLEQFHDILINRKIKKFTENDWWKWGRPVKYVDDPRVYVNCKTRNEKPFFIHESIYYDGSIMAIFPKKKDIDLNKFADMLNNVDWCSIGFKCGGRYLFSQKSLLNCQLPDEFKIFIP